MPPKKETKAVAVAAPAAPVITPNASSAEALIGQAIDKNVPVETMEKLLAMRRELKAEAAKAAFDQAMSDFQSQCPTITKSKEVKDKHGNHRYNFAPIDVIVSEVRPLLKACGLSFGVNTKVEEKWVNVVVVVKHTMGHSEVSEFKVPVDQDAYMSAPQKFAAALTFAKRYAFCNAFGILTGDEDNDAVDTDEPPKQEQPKQQRPAPIKVLPKQAPPPIKVLPKAAPAPSAAASTEEIVIDLDADTKETAPILLCEHCKKGGKDRDVDPASAELTKAETGMVLCGESLAAWRKQKAGSVAEDAKKERMETLKEYRAKVAAAASYPELDEIEGSAKLDKRVDAILSGTLSGLVANRRNEIMAAAPKS